MSHDRIVADALTPPEPADLRQAWAIFGTLKHVSREYGVSVTTAAIWLADVGIFVSDAPAITEAELLAGIAAGRTLRQIAADLHVGQVTVSVELRRHGLVDAHRRRPQPHTDGNARPLPGSRALLRRSVRQMAADTDAAWLDRQFAAGRTVADVAAEVGITVRGLRYRAHRLGVALPQHRTKAERRALLDDPGWLAAQRAAGRSVTDLARHLRVPIDELRSVLDRRGISSRRRRSTVPDAEIRRLIDEGLSYRAVARQLGVSPPTVRRHARQIGATSDFLPGGQLRTDLSPDQQNP